MRKLIVPFLILFIAFLLLGPLGLILAALILWLMNSDRRPRRARR